MRKEKFPGDYIKMKRCKCRECRVVFETEAPSRIQDSLCASCILEERRKQGPVGLPPDFEKVQRELRKEFGVCSRCNVTALTPLRSFKFKGEWLCEPCYSEVTDNIKGVVD